MIFQFFIFIVAYCLNENECYNKSTFNKKLTRFDKEASYCIGIINWPISKYYLQNRDIYDAIALDGYKKIYQRYKKQQVTVDCLGIGQYFFCAHSYPTCTNQNMEIEQVKPNRKICSWLCNLFQVRCPKLKDIYNIYCAENRIAHQNCSMGRWILLSLLIVFSLLN